jgi:arabinofuranosyltransferase
MLFAGFTADDAYITARYSRNLANGNGLVFNIGEQVSALTSPLHAIVLAGFYTMTNHALAAYKVVATLLVAITLFFACRHFKEPYSRVGFLALTVISPFVMMWTQGGLETPLLLVCITLIAWLTIERRNFIAVMFLSALAVTIRFDALLFVFPVIAYLTWARKLPPASFLFLAIPLAWLIFSQYYYGEILPTSFYIKTPSANVDELLRGLVYEGNWIVLSGLFAPLVLFRRGKSTSTEIAVTCGIALTMSYGLTAGVKHMMFGYRLFVPFLPTVAMLLLNHAKLKMPHIITIGILQVALFITILMKTVNPSINIKRFELSIGRFEYLHESLSDYVNSFLPALEANRIAIEKHWQSTHIQRPIRIKTFAAGILPYYMPDAHVFEVLVSFRKKCKIDEINSADYVHLVFPGDGTLEDQLGDFHGELIDSQVIIFNGAKQNFEVWFNYNPIDNQLSAKVNDAC